ncbi:diguanylate cyclase [candidate division KSB3 bacterium]|uniref:Diguanylate cyclase DosC n=1 Tax=candidate division KSB3 bacterium TaxID=2044937 RepID=A0A9D5JT73_9BACT|nr:diguanylate cyclase [candidate division KSB3 bacterium]MBD3323735.1 diguanylate cyclase [candidate division KSB3 bacterium]
MQNTMNTDALVQRVEFQRLVEIYTRSERPVLEKLGEVIRETADSVAATFYAEMLAIQETKPFLDNELVNKRLHRSLAGWLKMLFAPLTEEDVKNHILHQYQIGGVHDRINVPMSLVNHGLRVLKRECSRQVLSSDQIEAKDMPEALMLLNELLDYSAALINESYLKGLVENERNAQSLRMHVSTHSLAIECERLRSVLLDWLRNVLTLLYEGRAEDLQKLPSIYLSNFGLWVTYKAELLFSDSPEVIAGLKEQIQKIDASLRRAVECCLPKQPKPFTEAVTALNDHVTHTVWLLSSFVDRALEAEDGRDPLTRLFNRRYLPTIMQRTIQISLKHQIPFAILMLDIDHFKRVNDTYGHESGDSILEQFSQILTSNVRANDFVFRHGGEEFLVLLSGVEVNVARHIAEQLRLKIAQQPFKLGGRSQQIQITASIGVASHDGHPDYERLISRADHALYEAKSSGRNRVVIAL